jgi:hypothetical protein
MERPGTVNIYAFTRASASRRTRPAIEVATGLVVGQFALNACRYEAD